MSRYRLNHENIRKWTFSFLLFFLTVVVVVVSSCLDPAETNTTPVIISLWVVWLICFILTICYGVCGDQMLPSFKKYLIKTFLIEQ